MSAGERAWISRDPLWISEPRESAKAGPRAMLGRHSGGGVMLEILEVVFGLVLPFGLWWLHDRRERRDEVAMAAKREADARPGARLA